MIVWKKRWFLLNLALLCISFCPSSRANSEDCVAFLQNYLDKGPDDSIQSKKLIAYSGHNLNDIGNYQECRKLQTQKFVLLTIGEQNRVYGLCGPSYCQIPDLQQNLNVLSKVVSKLSEKEVTSPQIKLNDPREVGIEYDFWFVFALLFFAVLFLLSFIGTHSANQTRQAEALLAEKGLLAEDQNSLPEQHPVKNKKLIESFDLVSGLKELMKKEINPNHDQNLNILNGIRALSFFWVIWGHSFSMSSSRAKNYDNVEPFMKSFWALMMFGGVYAVDTFLYLSAFLATYLLLPKLKKMPFGAKTYLLIFFHRWIRIWPAYLAVILFFWKIIVIFGNSPIWFLFVQEAQQCSDSFWQNLLFLDNVLAKTHACIGWGWYLACDLQIFLLIPFVCWIYHQNRRHAKLLLVGLGVISMVFGYIQASEIGASYLLDAVAKGIDVTNFVQNFYPNPTIRMSVSLVGMWTAFKFREYKEGESNFFKRIHERKINRKVSSTIAISLTLSMIVLPGIVSLNNFPDFVALILGVFNRPLWAFGIFFLTAPGLVGNSKILRGLFNHFFFTLVSKLSFTGYLLHVIVIQMIIFNSNQYVTFSIGNMTWMAVITFIISCLGGVILNLLIERPLSLIEARLWPQKPSLEKSQVNQKMVKVEDSL